jgi:hypothetical protein
MTLIPELFEIALYSFAVFCVIMKIVYNCNDNSDEAYRRFRDE